MCLSNRVTELLENSISKVFNAMKTIEVPTNNHICTMVNVDDEVGGTLIVSANSNRVKLLVQNQSSQPVLINFSNTVSIGNYCMTLAGGSGSRLGDGGTFESSSWKGKIVGITESGTSTITVFEEVL